MNSLMLRRGQTVKKSNLIEMVAIFIALQMIEALLIYDIIDKREVILT